MSTLFDNPTIEEVPSKDEWDFKFMESIARGINLSLSPERIEDNEVLKALNVRVNAGQVLVDFGFVKFAQVVRGAPRASYQFFKKNGSSDLVLITNSTFYKWSSGQKKWHYVSDGVTTTTTATEPAGETSIAVTSETGFSAADFVGLILDDGSQHQTTVASTAANTVVLDDAIPAGRQSDSGAVLVKAVDLTGVSSIGVTVTTWAAFDKMYFANGKDTPKEYNGSTVVDISNLPTSPFICRVIIVFNNFLILMHTTESGTAFPQRVRWSNPGVDDNFNASVNFNDLYETEDWITSAQILSPYLIIYKERSIVRQEFLGTSDKTWNWTPTIDSEGSFHPDAIINLGDLHIFWGNSNVYEYKGGFDITPIGDNIYEKIFSKSGEINPKFSAIVHGLYVEEIDDIFYFYPKGNDEVPKNMIKYNVGTRTWTERAFSFGVTGFGFFESQGDLTWADATGTWETQDFPWVGKRTQSNSPTIHILGDDLQVYEYDYVADKDDGTAIAYEIETKDYHVPNRELRFDRYDFFMKGFSILVEASYDGGLTWITLGTVTPGITFKRQRLYRQQVARTIRFRFSGSAAFGLGWIGFKFKREAIWGP